jgi:DNA-binding XRE family transcriptional regulator
MVKTKERAFERKATPAVRAEDLEGLLVVPDEDGAPGHVLLPDAVWKRLGRTARAGAEATMLSAGAIRLAALPVSAYAAIRDDIEDAIDHVLADEGEASLAAERATVDRLHAEGIAVGVGVPFEVIQAERAGTHPIAAWRKHRGMTQVQLAKASGVDRSHLAHIEAGRKSGTVESFAAIARALGCLIEDLISAG